MGLSYWACVLTLLLVVSVEDARSQGIPGSADVELAVYGSGSFKEGMAVGDAPYMKQKGYNRLQVSGGQSEITFHDRNEVSCSPTKRWSLYATDKTLRSFRPGGTKGGFVIQENMSRFLQDLNVGGIIDTSTIQLSGVGDRAADSSQGEPMLIGNKQIHHLKMGYNTGHTWIQSVKTHLLISPAKSKILVGTETPQKPLTIDGGDLRVDEKLTWGGSDGQAFMTETKLQLANGGGWHMTDTSYLKSINSLPVYTKGGGKFMGNVGVGTLPKFPIFRLQVHQSVESEHGAVMVTDKADKGLTFAQTKEGALLRSWNIDTKKHEAMLVEAGPLLIQPRSGVVLFGTTVKKKRMHLHIKGNLYIHGHMFAMRNLHVKDHANLKHLLMPSISLKNKPQSADGDTLVLGHMKKKKEPASAEEDLPAEFRTKGPIISGINLRFGFHSDYTWIQVHGKEKGKHMPLAINPLGNTVAIGTISPDKKYQMHAAGNGYVLGELYVKMEGTPQMANTLEDARVTDMANLSNEMTTDEAMSVLAESEVRQGMLTETAEMQDEMLRSRMSLISVPAKLRAHGAHGQPGDVSVNKLTSVIHKVLKQQEAHMDSLDKTLNQQNEKIRQLQQRVAAMRK